MLAPFFHRRRWFQLFIGVPALSLFLAAGTASVRAATEELIDSRYRPAIADPIVGDWQAKEVVAQVIRSGENEYQANVLRAFDEPDAKPLAVLRGTGTALAGDSWTGAINGREFRLKHNDSNFALAHVERVSPTLGAKPPAEAVVLFDGSSLDAFAQKNGKQWLEESGPAPWRIVDGALEVVPGTGGGIISHQHFGDARIHAEFRILGAPSNSGIYLQARYEVNINDSYGDLKGSPAGGLDNSSSVKPKIRASRPVLAWQTLDIDFTAPRFDAKGAKIANARATVILNGVKLYDRQDLNPPKGAAGRLGEAATGPLMLQEHGMPVQFRNIWVLEQKN